MAEHWSREAELARLDKHGSSLDRFNVNLVCERMADYPELIAAVAALPDRLVVDLAGAREQIARAAEVAIGLGVEPIDGCNLCARDTPCPIHMGDAIATAVLAGWDGLG